MYNYEHASLPSCITVSPHTDALHATSTAGQPVSRRHTAAAAELVNTLTKPSQTSTRQKPLQVRKCINQTKTSAINVTSSNANVSAINVTSSNANVSAINVTSPNTNVSYKHDIITKYRYVGQKATSLTHHFAIAKSQQSVQQLHSSK